MFHYEEDGRMIGIRFKTFGALAHVPLSHATELTCVQYAGSGIFANIRFIYRCVYAGLFDLITFKVTILVGSG